MAKEKITSYEDFVKDYFPLDFNNSLHRDSEDPKALGSKVANTLLENLKKNIDKIQK